MSLEVSLKRRLKGFTLDTSFRTDRSVMGLLGASGSGKSMTLRCIAGIDKPDEGRIVLNGAVLYDSEKKICLPPQKRNVGYLFQNYALFPTMTAEQNIGISLTRKKASPEEKQARVSEMIRKYQLTGLEKRYPMELSGGQQQRVAMARMLITDPKVIMLDEPFSALDAFLREQMLQELLSMLKEYRGEVLLVSHSRDDIYKCCSELTIISEGKSLMTGETQEIFRNPQLIETCRLTGCKNISGAKKIGDRKIYAEDWMTELETEEVVGDDITAVGVRGHMIREVKNPESESSSTKVSDTESSGTKVSDTESSGTEVSDTKSSGANCLQVRQTGFVNAPFEYQYLVRNVRGGSDLWWMVAKDQEPAAGHENYTGTLFIPPDALMLLK